MRGAGTAPAGRAHRLAVFFAAGFLAVFLVVFFAADAVLVGFFAALVVFFAGAFFAVAITILFLPKARPPSPRGRVGCPVP